MRSAQLGRDHDIYQVVPDRHSTARGNNTMCEGRQHGMCDAMHQKKKLDNVMLETEKLKSDIVGVAEIRWTGKGEIVKQECKVASFGSCKHKDGVDFLLDN